MPSSAAPPSSVTATAVFESSTRFPSSSTMVTVALPVPRVYPASGLDRVAITVSSSSAPVSPLMRILYVSEVSSWFRLAEKQPAPSSPRSSGAALCLLRMA